MELDPMLQGEPKTWPGANKLLGFLRSEYDMIAQEIGPNAEPSPDAKPEDPRLKAIKTKMAEISERSGEGEPVGAFEERALEHISDAGLRKEPDLARVLGEDLWDVAAWCESAAEAGLLEQMGPPSVVPRRHWKLTVEGERSIGR